MIIHRQLGWMEEEIDGLLVIDGLALEIQAKSSPTRIDATAADAPAFESAIRSIITTSMRQHDDSRAALLAEDAETQFWVDDGGRRVPVRLSPFSDNSVVPLTVTLDDLSGCAPVAWQLRDAGLATSGELPWIVAATPLEVMLELIRIPAQFVHFLRRRAMLNKSRNLEVSDEIDVFSSTWPAGWKSCTKLEMTVQCGCPQSVITRSISGLTRGFSAART